MIRLPLFFFFFNDTATTEIYTLPLHDALPISVLIFSRLLCAWVLRYVVARFWVALMKESNHPPPAARSEEHTSELQSQSNLVCRLLLEKKKAHDYRPNTSRLSQLHLFTGTHVC